MPRFAANVSTMFTDVPMLQRFERAARAGFDAVEMQFPYEWPAQALRAQLDAHGLSLVLHNLPAGDATRGDRGLACHPGREAEFAASVETAIACARVLGAPRLHCMAGIAPPGLPAALLRQTLVANLAHAAAATRAAGLELLVEPINPRDIPGYWLNRPSLAFELVAEIGAPNLRVQYDLYHAQRTEGELSATLERELAHIGHVQFADNPGRHEPGTGEIRFEHLFALLDRIGYTGYVGAEYFPLGRTEDSLDWFAPYRRR